MSDQILRHIRLMSMFLVIAGSALGCTTALVPVSPADIIMPDTDEDHGWVLGNIELIRKEGDRTVVLREVVDMSWWLEEETDGDRFQISRLPIDGPFAVKLPTGSYRVTRIGFNNKRGVWLTKLPTEFRVQSRECTFLGTWLLQMRTGTYRGWIAREVVHDHGLTQDESGSMSKVQGCPTLVAPLESSVQRPIKLHTPVRVF